MKALITFLLALFIGVACTAGPCAPTSPCSPCGPTGPISDLTVLPQATSANVHSVWASLGIGTTDYAQTCGRRRTRLRRLEI